MKIKFLNRFLLVGAVHLSCLILFSSSLNSAVIQLNGNFYILQNEDAVAPPSPEIPTVVSRTGRIWMDRNLGASRAAISITDSAAYGDLYQWGRGTDGHEKRNSGTTTILSTSATPGHGKFILVTSYPYDWINYRYQDFNLWQGVSGVNNPCPAGFRLPTEMEWNAERLTWSSNDLTGAYNSPLKLTAAGGRRWDTGNVSSGNGGRYYSSTVTGDNGHFLYISNAYGGVVDARFHAFGLSVRCIMD